MKNKHNYQSDIYKREIKEFLNTLIISYYENIF